MRTKRIDLLIDQMICDYLITGNKHGLDTMIEDWYKIRFEGEGTVYSDVIKEQMKIRFRDRFEGDFLEILKELHEQTRKKK